MYSLPVALLLLVILGKIASAVMPSGAAVLVAGLWQAGRPFTPGELEVARIVMPGVFAAAQVGLTVMIIVLCRRAATGRLHRNPTTGIRTPSTMRSDVAWRAGHRAALRLTPLYLLMLAGMLAALVAATASGASLDAVVFVGIAGMSVFVPVMIVSAVVAGRAANKADEQPAEEPAAASTVSPPNRLSGKHLQVYAVVSGLLFALNCAVLWVLALRADNNAIPPNTGVGFRTAHTLSAAPVWYAAQRVGFHLAAIASTPIAVAVVAALAVAYARRVRPLWILLIPVLGGIALLVVILGAGGRAEHAALGGVGDVVID